MKPPFTLAPDTVSEDLVEVTRQLHEDAKQGSLAGLSFAAMYIRPTRRYIAEGLGEADRNPTFAIGTVIVLLYKLVRKIAG